jgi:hypothetical protein
METPNFKIAFLFLVIDDINYPTIWENYFRGNEDKISIYCHPKNPEKVVTPLLKSNIIPNLVETGWGYITNAYFTLFYEALKNPQNQKFVVISESCLPLKSFDAFYDKLSSDNIKTSYIKFWDVTPYDLRERLKNQDRYSYMIEKYGNFTKHYARFCLSRYHILKLFGLREEPDFTKYPTYQTNKALNFFNIMHVGDEFFLTLLNPFRNKGLIEDFEITYDDWEWVLQRKVYLTNKIAELEEEGEDAELERQVSKIKKSVKDKEQQKIKVREFKQKYKRDKAAKLEEYKTDLVINSGANPRTYFTVSNDDVMNALRKESFFWRKFPVVSNVIEFYTENGTPVVNEETMQNKTNKGGFKSKKCRTKQCRTKQCRTKKYRTKQCRTKKR